MTTVHSFLSRCVITPIEPPFDEIIKTAVNEAIKLNGSQKALAAKSGLSQGAISKYVLGKAKPRGEVALSLEKACDYRIHRGRFAPHIFRENAAA